MGYIYYTSNPAGMQSKAPRQPKAAEFLKVWFKYDGQSWESNAFSIYTRETANTRSVHSGGRSPGDCHHQRAGILRH